MKNINAPIKGPNILVEILFKKYFANNPIIKTLPQVKNVKAWKPIIKSVIKKLKITAAIYFLPKIAGM